MTSRGRGALALGVAVYLAAWVFGSRPLYPVAVGLLLAVLLVRAWVRLAAQPFEVRRRHGTGRDVVEGDDVHIVLEAKQTGWLPPPSLVAYERLGRLGLREVALARRGALRAGAYTLERAPRGRYALDPVELVIEDPFALQRTVLRVGEPEALLVYPRLVRLERLFSEGGAHAHEGRRLLLRRPSGYELHGVREWEQGESLRNVHWRSTAHRGQLMLKELEDAPRDEVVVLLDGEAATGGASFDVAVRAAGSVLWAHVRRGRRCLLVVNSAEHEAYAVQTELAGWRGALEVLAAVEPTGRTPVTALLAGQASPAARALELVLVTSRLTRPLADRLVERALSRRPTSLVYLDTSGEPEPALLRLQSAGIPVAVLRPGNDLAAVLGDGVPGQPVRVEAGVG
jgi:uncharacterized protein (DUF58 family)